MPLPPPPTAAVCSVGEVPVCDGMSTGVMMTGGARSMRLVSLANSWAVVTVSSRPNGCVLTCVTQGKATTTKCGDLPAPQTPRSVVCPARPQCAGTYGSPRTSARPDWSCTWQQRPSRMHPLSARGRCALNWLGTQQQRVTHREYTHGYTTHEATHGGGTHLGKCQCKWKDSGEVLLP